MKTEAQHSLREDELATCVMNTPDKPRDSTKMVTTLCAWVLGGDHRFQGLSANKDLMGNAYPLVWRHLNSGFEADLGSPRRVHTCSSCVFVMSR